MPEGTDKNPPNEHSWVVAWIENYHENDRIEPRWCSSVEEAVALSIGWEESDDHHVMDIETPDGLLAPEEEREIEARLRQQWAAQRAARQSKRRPDTHAVDVRIPQVVPALPEDWRNWGNVSNWQSEEEAQKDAAEWVAMLGPERVRIRELRVVRP